MIAETSFIKNICYISPLVRKKVTHPLTQKVPLMDNAWKLHVSTYTVYRKHYQFTFKKHYVKLSKIMSWKEFGFKKGDLVFVTQNYESSELIILFDKGLQITIQNYFFLYSLKARQKVQFIAMDISDPISHWLENAF